MTVKVVDASALASILFREDAGARVAAELQSATSLAAPPLLHYELANTCWKKCRQHPGDRELLMSGFKERHQFAIVMQTVEHDQVVQLALATGLSAYDAAYLWLSRQLRAELVTLDQRLARIALTQV